jgi:hypothetical protein
LKEGQEASVFDSSVKTGSVSMKIAQEKEKKLEKEVEIRLKGND